MAQSYDAYFASGLYQSRYPRPNRRTLRFLSEALPVGGSLLDYGAGEGRYAFALAAMRRADVVAVDISAVARAHLVERALVLGLAERVAVCDDGDAFYESRVVGSGRFDVALLGFGVLGHVPGRRKRIELLAELRSSLVSGGRIVLGLPNARRRFREAQADAALLIARGELEPGDICYERKAEQDSIALFYHLFRRDEIRDDLAAAGFVLERLTVESVLPERAITHSAVLGGLDDLASSLVPIDWGYGYLAIARRQG